MIPQRWQLNRHREKLTGLASTQRDMFNLGEMTRL